MLYFFATLSKGLDILIRYLNIGKLRILFHQLTDCLLPMSQVGFLCL